MMPGPPSESSPDRYFTPCRKRKFYKKDGRIFRLVRRYKRQEKRFYWCEWCNCYHLTSEEKK